MKNKPVLVILGCTSSGKTSLGVKLAQVLKGEIISADSRQVYKGMDIGTGKDLKEFKVFKKIKGQTKTINIKHHLLDIVSPQTKFSLARYQKLAFKALADVQKRDKWPIIVGGTGLYLQAVVNNYQLSGAKPDLELRKKLEKLSLAQLFARLEKLNSDFANKLNHSDQNNPRRLVRYLEIFYQDQKFKPQIKTSPYQFVLLGLDWPLEVLRTRIKHRLLERLNNEGLVAEVKKLHRQGVSWKRLESFGLEYKFVAQYLQKQLTYKEMVDKLYIAICQFAKRQKTWWKRWKKQGAQIHWVKTVADVKKIIKAKNI